jgi:hypothetical protein
MASQTLKINFLIKKICLFFDKIFFDNIHKLKNMHNTKYKKKIKIKNFCTRLRSIFL